MSADLSCSLHSGDDANAVAHWVGAHIAGGERGFGPCTALSVAVRGRPIAGLVFHNWSPECGVIEMSAAAVSPRWMSRAVIRAAHRYIFGFCQLAVMRVSEDNARMCRIAERLGYTPHTIPRLRGRETAEIIYTLTDDAWQAGKFEASA